MVREGITFHRFFEPHREHTFDCGRLNGLVDAFVFQERIKALCKVRVPAFRVSVISSRHSSVHGKLLVWSRRNASGSLMCLYLTKRRAQIQVQEYRPLGDFPFDVRIDGRSRPPESAFCEW